MKKICFKLLCVSAIIVFIFNSIFIAAVAFVSEKETPEFLQEGTFFEILTNDNSNIGLNDYCLLNWAGSKEGKQLASDLPPQVVDGKFNRVNRFEAVLVQLLQNKFNSIVQVVSVDIYNENRGNAAGHASFLKIGKSYYIIVGYTLNIEEKLEYTTAVFKAESDVSAIKLYETEKPRFNDYEFYPLSLSPLLSTTFDKILNVLFVIGEVAVVYLVLVRRKKTNQGDQSCDGSMIEP